MFAFSEPEKLRIILIRELNMKLPIGGPFQFLGKLVFPPALYERYEASILARFAGWSFGAGGETRVGQERLSVQLTSVYGATTEQLSARGWWPANTRDWLFRNGAPWALSRKWTTGQFFKRLVFPPGPRPKTRRSSLAFRIYSRLRLMCNPF